MTTKLATFIIFLFISVMGYSQQLVYTPSNPAFGGNPYNYNWMLSSATAQNKLTADPNASEEKSELEKLGESINRQLLSQISRTLLQQQLEGFGSFDQEGTFTYGTLNIEIYRSGEGLVINILDTTNGEETQIIIPN
jgi:curli production assembly/transport component CsgF